jgi:hypothetical protein
MMWMGYVAHMGKKRNAYKVSYGTLKERGCLEHLSVDGSIILKPHLKK